LTIELKNLGLLSLFLLLVSGCLGLDSYSYDDSSTGSSYYGVAESAPVYEKSSDSTYITKEGSITIKVQQGTLETKFADLKDQLTAEGATFSNIGYNEYSDSKEYYLTMKISPSDFDSILEMIKQAGEVKDISVQLEDVTQSYTDLETRITNKQIELDRLRSLYNKSNDIEDLLAVEEQLTRVETEYELLQQQKQYLDSRIQKSTIYLTIYEDKPATQELVTPFEELGSLFFASLAAAIAVIVAIAGFLIPVLIVLWIIWVLYKKIRGKNQTSKTR